MSLCKIWSIYWCCRSNCNVVDSKADVAFQSTCEEGDRLWFMLRCMASKPWMRLLNKLNKSSIIHPGPEVCLAHADQRHVLAACNIPHWKRRSAGKCQQLAVNTVLCVQARELGANSSTTPVHRIKPCSCQQAPGDMTRFLYSTFFIFASK